MTRAALLSCAALLAAATAAAAQTGQPLQGEALKQLVAGKRIYLAVPAGGEFPLYYQAGGQIDGSGEAVGLGRFLKPSDKGRWWVSGQNLCQQWESWYQGRTICFTITALGGGRLRWVQDNGDTGIARIDR